MTTTHQDEQRERRATLENDRRVREQQPGSTLSQFATAEAETDLGRFTAHEKSTVIGSTPVPLYPAGPAWSRDPVGPEPALGIDINKIPPCGEAHEVEASIAAQEEDEPPRAA